MSNHIGAKKGDIAESILLPGDPLRAKYIAENFMTDVKCYNNVRGMLGYTGFYKGERVSVQGTGMGIPSISIYAHELMNDYGVKNLIRVGSCGAMQKDVEIRDVILAQAVSTDSNINHHYFEGLQYSPTANFDLLYNAYQTAQEKDLHVHAGNVYSSDVFYNENESVTDKLANHGVLAVEMEAAALYTLAAKFNRKALAILTVSDHLITGEATSADEREKTFNDMITLALDSLQK